MLEVPSRHTIYARARAVGLSDSGRVPLLSGSASRVAGTLSLSGREQDDGDRVSEQGRSEQDTAEAQQARHAGILPDAFRSGRLPGVPGGVVRRQPSENQAVARNLRGGPLFAGERLRDGRRGTVRRPVPERLRLRTRSDASVRHDDEACDVGLQCRRQEHVHPAPTFLSRCLLVSRLRRPSRRAVLPDVWGRPSGTDGGPQDPSEAAREDGRNTLAASPLRPVSGQLITRGAGGAGSDRNGRGGLRRLGRREER